MQFAKRLLVTVFAFLGTAFVFMVVTVSVPAGPPEPTAMENGDTNGDGNLDVSDAVHLLLYLFRGGSPPAVIADSPELVSRINALEVAVTQLQEDVTKAEDALAEAAASVVVLEGKTTLSDLLCGDGEIAKREAGEWVCAPDKTETFPPLSEFTPLGVNRSTGLQEYRHNQTGIIFVLLAGGTFDMGSPLTERVRSIDEGPVHKVSLSPFLIAKREVTQAQYETVMTGHATLNATPSAATGATLPVEQVSWSDLHLADGFLERTGLTLPSEAQWEYACRAGRAGPYSGTGNLDDMGWYESNSGGQTHDVGTKQTNQFGLQDTHGNVFEWCEDAFDAAFYGKPEALVPNPVATPGSVLKVHRGGSFDDSASFCRSAYRGFTSPTFRDFSTGLRLARSSP